MNDIQYYVRSRGRITGPFQLEELQKMSRRGTLSRVHEVSADQVQWTAAGEYEDLFPSTYSVTSSGAASTASTAVAVVDEGKVEIATQAPDVLEYGISRAAEPTARSYFFSQDGSVVGPVAETVLVTLAENGSLSADAAVWRNDETATCAARQISFLAPIYLRHKGKMDATAHEPSYAGFWRRFGAAFVDGIIGTVISIIIIFIAGFFIAILLGDRVRTDTAQLMIILIDVAVVVVNWLYFACFESSSLRATPGKLACGIRVTDTNGRQISFLRATGRHFGKFLSSMTLTIGYCMAGWTEKKQALHDMICECLVVNR